MEKIGIQMVYAQNQQELSTFWDILKINGNSYEMNALPFTTIDSH